MSKIIVSLFIKRVHFYKYNAYRETGDATDFNNLFYRWYDYQYGGMYDYVAHIDSVRAVKYTWGNYYNYIGLQDLTDTCGVYTYYSNVADPRYLQQTDAYLQMYNHYDHFYNAKAGENRKGTREKQLMAYIREGDIGKENEDIDKEEFANDLLALKNSKLYKTQGVVESISMKELEESLDSLYTNGNVTFEWKNNTVTVYYTSLDENTPERSFKYKFDTTEKYGGIEYTSYEQYSDFLYSLELNVDTYMEYDPYHLEYYDYEETAIAKAQVDNYLSQRGIIISSKEEYDEYVYNYIIGGRAEDLLVDSYYTAQTRKVDEFNKYKDFVVESIQAISFMVSLANPGTYVAVGLDLLAGGASIADGGIRLAQGDLEGGTQELAMSVPFFLLSCKDLKPLSTQKVQYAHVDELAEDLKFSINEEALDNFVDYKNYQEYWDKLESGQYIHPGMSDEEFAKWMYSDSKVGDYLSIEKVNYDDILSLRKSERMSQTIDDAASVKKIIASEGSNSSIPDKGFNSFKELKAELGSPGEGNAWHHIVEQSQIGKSGFSSKQINNVNNVISIPHGKGTVHAKISGYYSSKRPFTGGKTVREWLSGKSFQEQFDFGMDILKQYGDVTPSNNGWIFTPFN